MDDFRRFPKGNTRQLIDYNRFASLTGEKQFLCLDRGVMEIFRYFAHSRASWRTTFYTSVSDDGYIIPTIEQFELVQHALAEANEDMSSCDDLVASLEGIREAILATPAAGSGGSGCGCIGSGDTDVTDVNDTGSEDIPQGDEFPPGYSSREEFDEERCKAAWFIVRNYIQTLRNWAGLFGMVGGLSLAVITGLLLLTVPPVGLMAILGAMGILVGLDIGLLIELNNIAQGLEDNDSEIVCSIYNAETSGAAVTAMQNAANSVIDGLSLSLADTYKVITGNLISHEQMEILFTPTAEIQNLPAEDCSACMPALYTVVTYNGCTPELNFGNFLEGQSTQFESCTTSIYGDTRANTLLASTAAGVNRRVEVTGYSGGTNGLYLDWFDEGVHQTPEVIDPGGSIVGMFWEASSLHFARLGLNDTTPYTLTVEVTEL